MGNKKFYCVGNAHLDPMWLWRWQEGSAEAKATIRSALDRMKEYPEFKFVCAASGVFEWIEEFDAEMFGEIRERIKEGRFIIVGGWFVQPDCNSPSGESFARHGLYGQRYFKEKFGVTAHTGYNVDSFGHNAMLPQILKKQGMDNYIFMRPASHEKELPEELFNWVAPDGSKVLASRIPEPYCRNIRDEAQTDEEIQKAINHDKANDNLTFFYGVGNHGGGPTKQNIEMILKARERHSDKEFIFSTLEDYFEVSEDKKDKIPEIKDDLQYHAIGCYSAHSKIKDSIRRAECELTAAESFGMMAKAFCNKAYPDTKEFENAWKNVLFSHFHDSMGGCSIKSAHDDILLSLDESRSFAMRKTNNALQTLSWQVDSHDASKGFPWIVFNPHPFEVKAVISHRCRGKSTLHDEEGNVIPFQKVHLESCLVEPWNDCLATEVTVAPFGYATVFQKYPNEENPVILDYESKVSASDTTLENTKYIIKFEKHTGYITSLYDKEKEKELIKGFGAVPVVIDEAGYDTWAHFKTEFNREIAKFSDAKITVTENGPVRATLKIESYYNKSKLTQYFSLTESGTPEIKAIVDWREKRKMLKLRFETAFEGSKSYCEIPFGIKERQADGKEYPALKWQALKNSDGGLAVINNNKYSFSAKGTSLDMTVIRSPYYADHTGLKEDSEGIFMDQGEHEFSYGLIPVYEESFSKVIKAAALLNQPVTLIAENNHEGRLPFSDRGISVDKENIIVSAIKRSEDNNGIVIRAYECDGKKTKVTISGKLLPKPLTAEFTPYSVNTYYLADGKNTWEEVLMTEFKK